MKQSYYISSFFWSISAKLITAVIGFLSIPLLLSYLGKTNYAILTLAISCNAYVALLDMGVNTGAIKFFSQWREKKQYLKINRVAKTNITFYLCIGAINAFILVAISIFNRSIFSLSAYESNLLSTSLYILAFFAIFSWPSSVFNQLLISCGQISFTQKILVFRGILNFIIILLTIKLESNYATYFFMFSIINTSIIIPYYIKCKQLKILNNCIPEFHWNEFKPVLYYSFSILGISFFQMFATYSRPIILGIFSPDGIDILSDYRILEVFPMFIISLGGIFTTIFLPKASVITSRDNFQETNTFVEKATLYMSIITICLCLPIIINAKEIITLYVGSEYAHLYKWLIIWVAGITLYLHSSPAYSLILAKGKTKKLMLITALSSLTSIIINIIISSKLGIGAPIISFVIYIIIQMLFYYLYFYKYELHINQIKILQAFIIPTICGISSGLITITISHYFSLKSSNLLAMGLAKSFSWLVIYTCFLFFFNILNIKEIKMLLKQ